MSHGILINRSQLYGRKFGREKSTLAESKEIFWLGREGEILKRGEKGFAAVSLFQYTFLDFEMCECYKNVPRNTDPSHYYIQ